MNMPDKFRNQYRIKSTRLPDYDYSRNGYYFITICTHNREHFFGEITNGEMRLSEIGKIALKYWLEIPDHFSFVVLDTFVIMPNHVHGIIVIYNDAAAVASTGGFVETRHCLVSTATAANRFQNQGKNTVSSIIGSYKSICTKTINIIKPEQNFAWQPRFYDHVIRNEKSLNRIRNYIANNPINWQNDRNN